jgi:hypothetical protein
MLFLSEIDWSESDGTQQCERVIISPPSFNKLTETKIK